MAVYRALAIFKVNRSSLVRYGNPRENNVESKCVSSTSAGTCGRRYNAERRKTSGKTVFSSLQNTQSTDLPSQMFLSLSFVTYPVDNERVLQSILLVLPECLATLSTPLGAGNCLN
jgi:hypothetical protein